MSWTTSDLLGIGGLAIGLVGAFPTVVLLRQHLRGHRPLRRLLGFQPKKTVNVLVTTSKVDISVVGPANNDERARRALLPSGDLAAAAELSVLLWRAYPKTAFRIRPSTDPLDKDTGDRFIVGGPIHNNFARSIVDDGASSINVADGVILDAPNRYISVGSTSFGPNVDLEFSENVPSIDYGIVLLKTTHRREKKSRLLLVAGLTTFGTHAAAYFATHQLKSYAKKEKFGKSPDVCILVRGTIVNGEPEKVVALTWKRLP